MDTIDYTLDLAAAGWCGFVTEWEPEATREAWLNAAIKRLAVNLFPGEAKLPAVRVTCGWPKGVRGGKHAIGQCWDSRASADATHEIFISPELDDPAAILKTVAHEMVHAVVGCEAGHKAPFIALARKIGLVKPWTSSTASPELRQLLNVYAYQLGPYPHARLSDGSRRKQGTRLLKASCPDPDCEVREQNPSGKPYTVRITAQWADLALPTCPCGTTMVLAEAGENTLAEAA